jgi:Terminase small subunit
MSFQVAEILQEQDYGPAMRALTDKQQRFVVAMIETGTWNMTECARIAGYSGNDNTMKQRAFELTHSQKIADALEEMVRKSLKSGAAIAQRVLFEIALDPTHKDRLKAAENLLNRSGLHAMTEHKMTVTHTMDDKEMIARIRNLAGTLGLDAQKLIGTAGVVEGEFEVVENEWEAIDA